MRASRGAERTPFPIRSTKRTGRTWGQAAARATRGRSSGRETVACDDERLPARGPVGKAPGNDLHRGGRRLRDPLDQPERDRAPGSVARRTGRSGKIISDEASVRNETAPSARTVRGRREGE